MSDLLIDGPRACVTGHPIAHSRSPMIHNYWLKTLNIKGYYDRVDTPPDVFPNFIRTMRDKGYVGCNVTLPNKELAYQIADVKTDRANRLHAANTLWFENGKLHADNTDIEGFLFNLDESAPGWDHNLDKAVILGAGGAAAAIIQALSEKRASKIIIVNRTLEKAEDLARRFGGSIETTSFEKLSEALDQATFLVNTTSLGMKGQPPLDLDLSRVSKSALVTDIVYVPLITNFLKSAQDRGLSIVDGLGMLLHQAVPGFEHWFGQRPQVTAELRALIEADIIQVNP
ncbi:MAG: shikimate dehydrogenase [Alphaproteobacteria bacterium]